MSDNPDPVVDNSFEQESLTPIRDHLVNTAVNFLLNPDVQKKNDDSKVGFLKKKGLTEAEISAAFEKAKYDPRYGLHSSANLSKTPPPPLPPIHYQPYSFWSRLSGISTSLIVFGVAIYGLHYFYKKYIRPWILGEEYEEATLNKHVLELTKNLTLLTETVDRLQIVVVKQSEEINKILQLEASGYAPTPVILEEMKREISSLKSILISRHQFPSVPQLPTTKATIPSWQLPNDYQEPENKPVDLVTNSAKPIIPDVRNDLPCTSVSDPLAMTDQFNFEPPGHETPNTSLDLSNSDQHASPSINSLPGGNNEANHPSLNEEDLASIKPEFESKIVVVNGVKEA